MGISCSCPFAEQNDVETGLESVVVKSICLGDDEVKTPVRSVSFGNGDLEPKILKSLGSGKMMVETSVSFKGGDLEQMMSVKAPFDGEQDAIDQSASVDRKEIDNSSMCSDNTSRMIQKFPVFDPTNPMHQAAIKLQKVYKSFRTRRKLADCAVLVEQSWWKLLDFAELKRSSVSFFDIEKHETAISRWSRARVRAAKVGKGLSKNDKAQKLALQHWLEAIDPRHRYGHNLHFYYDNWLHSKSREPFFYWLDIGEGKEVNLVEKCPRSKLQQQCIKYLGPMERMAYEVCVEDGKLLYKQTGDLLHTTDDAKWIFVLSSSKTLYVGKKKKGTFQHSSFLAGGVAIAAGRLIVESGNLKAVWPHSGHYRPTEENFKDFLSFLEENNVDLIDVQTSPIDEEEGSLHEQTSRHLRNHSSDEDLIHTVDALETEEINIQGLPLEDNDLLEDMTSTSVDQQMAKPLPRFSRKLTSLEIPKKSDLFETVESENPSFGSSAYGVSTGSLVEDGYESSEEGLGTKQHYIIPNENLSDLEQERGVGSVPEESILKRINSKKAMNSFQLGKQLSCKWTTGAGPRIGCVRDYPSELQFRAMEQVSLSPRSIGHSRSIGGLSLRIHAPTGFGVEVTGTMASPVPLKGANLERNVLHLKAKSMLPPEPQQWLQ